MGRFESYVFENGAWGDTATGITWLGIRIHDSSIATIGYSLSADDFGSFYLGFQPRDYFEEPDDHEAVDCAAQAAGLSRWASTALAVEVDPARIEALMATESVDEPLHVFVEDTVVELLQVLTLSLPADLS